MRYGHLKKANSNQEIWYQVILAVDDVKDKSLRNVYLF